MGRGRIADVNTILALEIPEAFGSEASLVKVARSGAVVLTAYEFPHEFKLDRRRTRWPYSSRIESASFSS